MDKIKTFDRENFDGLPWSKNSMVRGHHIYKDVWDARSDISEVLESIREPANRSDTHAVAVKKGELIVHGHVLRFISPICSIFIQRGSVIKCRITGKR